MAELAGRPVSASMKLAIDYDPGPDTGADDHDYEVVDPVAETEPLLGRSQGVGVVLQDDR